VAQRATFALPKALFERADSPRPGSTSQWNREGAEVAIAKVYPSVKRNQLPDAAYTAGSEEPAMIAPRKAGYRLAAPLEAALATGNSFYKSDR
jgi:hypothetical protein